MKKLWLRTAVSLALIIAAVYVVAFGNMWLNETSLIFVGADPHTEEPFKFGDRDPIPWDTARVTTEDGVQILVLESQLTGSPEAPWVIYFYGQAGRLADEKSVAMYDLFREAGLNVLAMEYRGYGVSEKTELTEAGVYADARAAWRPLSATWGVPAERVVLYGYSLGGGVATGEDFSRALAHPSWPARQHGTF
jgi:pimeloyl-ACP methyl ester carboxylesterase